MTRAKDSTGEDLNSIMDYMFSSRISMEIFLQGQSLVRITPVLHAEFQMIEIYAQDATTIN